MAQRPDEEMWDDPELSNNEVLYRHLHPDQYVEEAGTGNRRLSSAFLSVEPGEDGISVYSATLLKQNGFQIEDILPTERHGYVELTVGIARGLGWGVVPDPNDELPVNVAHMLIKPSRIQLSRRKRRDLSLALAGQVTIVKYPQL